MDHIYDNKYLFNEYDLFFTDKWDDPSTKDPLTFITDDQKIPVNAVDT